MKTVLQMTVVGLHDNGRPCPPRAIRLVIDDKLHHFEERRADRLGELGWFDMERDSESAAYIDPYYLQRVMLRVLALGDDFEVIEKTDYRTVDLGDVVWSDHMINGITRT